MQLAVGAARSTASAASVAARARGSLARTHLAASLDGRRHGASPMIRGHAESVVLDGGRLREHLVAVEARDGHVVAHDGRARRRGATSAATSASVEGREVRGVLEDRGELAGVALELLLGQLEARERGDVGDVVAGERVTAARRRPISRNRPVSASIELGVVVERGDVVAALEPDVLDGAGDLARDELGVLGRDDVVLSAGEDERRARDLREVRGHVLQAVHEAHRRSDRDAGIAVLVRTLLRDVVRDAVDGLEPRVEERRRTPRAARSRSAGPTGSRARAPPPRGGARRARREAHRPSRARRARHGSLRAARSTRATARPPRSSRSSGWAPCPRATCRGRAGGAARR